MTLERLYRRLHAAYGPQGWWPTRKRGYDPANPQRRLTERDRLEICVGAILTQNTAWRNAQRALEALAAARRLTLKALALADQQELAELIRPSGYFNQKAERLIRFAGYVRGHYGSCRALLTRPTEALRAELLALKGIGPETADSMLLYAGGHPVFVIDAYTERILSRLGYDAGRRYADWQALLQGALPSDPVLFNDYHALFVRHAVARCHKRRPACGDCPVLADCTLADD